MNVQLNEIYRSLGIEEKHLKMNRLSFQKQPSIDNLKIVDLDFEGKPFVLALEAATAWIKMKSAAQQENIILMPFSGFRSYLHQKGLIERHLKNGRPLENILTHIAIPGFSEHHSGRAIDIHAKDRAILEEAFEQTLEFNWLLKNASFFGFSLSYPRSNAYGIIYEPWHWLYSGT